MPEKNLSYHTLGGEQAKQLEFALSKQLNELRSRAVPPGGIVGDLKKTISSSVINLKPWVVFIEQLCAVVTSL
jgi:hypothetical protein